jgi:hypothetical protein
MYERINVIPLAGFDPLGEPEIRQMADGSRTQPATAGTEKLGIWNTDGL